MCNIVLLDGHKYLVDVGFGNNAPTFAVPLLKDQRVSYRNTGDSRGGSLVHISREQISETATHVQDELMWVYSFKYLDEMPWIPGYCFSELECLSGDQEVMNFYTSQHPESWFRRNVVVSRVLFGDTGRAIGDLTLFNGRVKERRFGRSHLLCEAQGREDIPSVLHKYFNIAV